MTTDITNGSTVLGEGNLLVASMQERLNTAVALAEEAKAEVERLKAEHEAFKVRASDVLAAAADDRDLCEAYDDIAESAGLYRRPHNQDVEIEVTYRQVVTIQERTSELANAHVRAQGVTSYFMPSHPYQGDAGIVDRGPAYAVAVKVIE